MTTRIGAFALLAVVLAQSPVARADAAAPTPPAAPSTAPGPADAAAVPTPPAAPTTVSGPADAAAAPTAPAASSAGSGPPETAAPTAAPAGTSTAPGPLAVSRPGPGTPPLSPPPTTLPPSRRSLGVGFLEKHRGKRLVWDPAFNRMDAPEMVLTSAAVGVALAGAILTPLKTHWRGGFFVDDAVRSALRAPSYQARLDARDASDVGLAMITTIPILVDSVIVAYWYRGSDDVALQMALIDAEAMAVAAAVQGAANFLGGRERPYGVDCGTAISNNTIDCQSPSRYRSFFSGHSALSFTSAGLICAHHLALDLFENAADPAMCASAFVAAGAIATLRMVGDMHYLSDVLTGAVVGTAVGLGIPLLHHYRRTEPSRASALQLQVLPSWGGAQLVGTF